MQHHVLLVENSPVLSGAIKSALMADHEFSVSCLTKVQTALSAFDVVVPDLAIVDFELSDRSAMAIADRAAQAHVPVILLGEPQNDRLRRAKPYPILAKPFEMDDLLQSARWLVAQTVHCRQLLGDNLALMQRLQRELQEAIETAKTTRMAVEKTLARSRRQRAGDL